MKNKKINIAAVLLISVIVLLAQCTKKVGKPIVTNTGNNCDTITYDVHIKPIMDKYCISCHGDPLSGGAPVFLNTYSSVKASGENGSLKKTVIDEATMPLGSAPLPQAEQNLIECWISNGMIENISYTSSIKSIIDKNCVTCHDSPPKNGAPFELTTYTSVKTIADNGSLERTVITNSTMPKGGPPLSKADQDQISFWLDHNKTE